MKTTDLWTQATPQSTLEADAYDRESLEQAKTGFQQVVDETSIYLENLRGLYGLI